MVAGNKAEPRCVIVAHNHGDVESTVEKTNTGLSGSYCSSLPHPARQSSADVQSALVYRIGDSALRHCEMLSSLHTSNTPESSFRIDEIQNSGERQSDLRVWPSLKKK